ncbi:hypothetical protein [Phytohabitans aurantiacus]|uniref:DUF222 domain-containing protein n=1 Tax=Phytohabitans aurantiacus TaxID=3016789 RepID=A0ABQ5R501_9ACTN|nr:hypothetical protein [Phytohabitans aurantiacus]GLI00651.1 hypothetical protein Pa4123_59270 [Phytohabitans aurantiacus]
MSESDLHDDWPASALQAADKAFAALTIDPAPLTLDCAALIADGASSCGTAGTADAGTAASGTSGTSGTGTYGTAESDVRRTTAAGCADPTAGSFSASAPSGNDLDVPPDEVPLPALRDWLMAHPNAYTARDAVWRELIRRARQGKPEWVIAAVGMAMPALVAMAGTLAAGYRGEAADIDAEVLTGFLEALRGGVDPARDAPHASLCFAAWRAGRELRLAQQRYLLVEDIEHAAATSRLPCQPYGHVDLLVYRAQALGLIDSEDVEPYIAIRLGRRTPELVAEAQGIDLDMLRMRLNRADTRLAWALNTGILTGPFSPQVREELAKRHDTRTKIRAGKAAAARRGGRRPRTSPAAAAA